MVYSLKIPGFKEVGVEINWLVVFVVTAARAYTWKRNCIFA